MKTKMKMLIVLACAVVIVASSVLGTLAYLTDEAEAVNTFTVGKVAIKLDEAKVNPDGTPVASADRVPANEYHLIPGGTYTKDPTVTVLADSETSYVRMLLTVVDSDAVDALIANPIHNLTDYAGLFEGWDTTSWLYQGFTKGTTEVTENGTPVTKNTITFEFWYKETVAGAAGADVTLPALFTAVKIPATATGDEMATLGNVQVVVNAHAIQAAGFADTVDPATGTVTATAQANAWAAFSAQTQSTNP